MAWFPSSSLSSLAGGTRSPLGALVWGLLLATIACGQAIPPRTAPAPPASLSPDMLLAPVLPGRVRLSTGAGCPSPWQEFVLRWATPQAQTLASEARGVESCWLTYTYPDLGTAAQQQRVSHDLALLASEQDAERLWERIPRLVAAEFLGDVAQAQDVQTLPLEAGDQGLLLVVPPEQPESMALELTDLYVIAFRVGRSISIIRLEGWLAALSPAEALQVARVGESTVRAGEQLTPTTPEAVTVEDVALPASIYLVGDEPQALLGRLGVVVISDALDEAAAVYNEHAEATGYRLRFSVESIQEVPWQGPLTYPQAFASLTQRYAEPCRIEVFYVSAEERTGGWGWVLSTAVFINASVYGDVLGNARRHGLILAHELGHLWALRHQDRRGGNVMSTFLMGRLITPGQARLIGASIGSWLRTCGDE